MAIEVSQNEDISDGGRKGVGSAIRRRRTNRESINIKKRERVEAFYRDVDSYIIRVGVK